MAIYAHLGSHTACREMQIDRFVLAFSRDEKLCEAEMNVNMTANRQLIF